MTRTVWWLLLAASAGCGVESPVDVVKTANIGAPDSPVTGTPRTWRAIATAAPFSPAGMAMMQDGAVMMQDLETSHWWKLAPDDFGQYDNGTFTQLGDMPSGYAPLWFASATLPDGKFIVEGGEYNGGGPGVWTTQGAIYDPIANSWQAVSPPTSWTTIGDASGIVRPDGTFMLSDCCSTNLAALDEQSLTWTPAGANKADENDEESWAELADGKIITADADVNSPTSDEQHSELYDPTTDSWSSAGMVPVELSDIANATYEVGPEMFRPDGTVVAIGGTPHNAIYDSNAGTWSALQDTPGGLATIDGPGATLPNGDVIFATGPYDPNFDPPTHFFEISSADNSFTEVGMTMNGANNATYQNVVIILPTGELLHTDFSSTVEIYTPEPGYDARAVPIILDEPTLVGSGAEPPTAPVPTLYHGRSYTLPMQRMNGISLGAVYGDDAQTSTNYPLVRLTASTTNHVFYCRTHDPSNRSIDPTSTGTATFDIPDGIEGGLMQLSVIANGVPSAALTVNVK